MFDLFLDFFTHEDNIFTRMDARTKMIAAITLICAIILSTKILLPLIVLVMCLSIPLFIGVPTKLLLSRLLAPGGIVLVLIVLKSLTTYGKEVFAISVLGVHFSVTREGLASGMILGTKVFSAVSVMIFLGTVAPAYKIFHALRWFRVSGTFVETALLVYRYIFILVDQTSDILAAQKVRLGYSSFRTSLRSIGVLGGMIIIRSLDQAARTYEAMSLRGYDGETAFDPLPPLPQKEFVGLLIAAPLVVTLYILGEWCSL